MKMKKMRFVMAISLYAMIFSLAVQAQTKPTHQLTPSGHEIVSPAAGTLQGLEAPYWSGEFLVQKAFYTHGPDDVSASLWDAKGQQVATPHIWFAGSSEMHFSAVIVSSANALLASGYTKKSDGTTAMFIAESDFAGHIGRVIQVNPLIVEHICVVPDGTVWAFGDDRNTKGYLLRHYDLSKGFLEGYLPVSDFVSVTSDPSAKWPAQSRGGRQPVYLTCTANTVGIYSGTTQEWIELNTTTRAISRYAIRPTQPYADAAPDGLAQVPSGRVYASLWRHRKLTQDERELGIYELQKDSSSGAASWVHLPSVDDSEPIGLLGNNGEALVHYQKGHVGLFSSQPKNVQ